jgi:hypothetical protein
MAYQIIKKTGTKWVKQPNRIVKTFSSGLCMIQQDYIAANSDVDYFAFREGDAISDSKPCIDGAYIFPAPDYQDMGNGFIKCTITAYGRVNTSGKIEENLTIGDRSLFTYQINNVFNKQFQVTPVVNTTPIIWVPSYFFGENAALIPKYIQKIVLNKSEVGKGIVAPQVDVKPLSIIYGNFNYIPYNIYINFIAESFGDRTATLDYNGFTISPPPALAFPVGSFNQGAGWEEVTSGVLINSINEEASTDIKRIDSVNYGFFTEYTLTFSARFSVKFNISPKAGFE